VTGQSPVLLFILEFLNDDVQGSISRADVNTCRGERIFSAEGKIRTRTAGKSQRLARIARRCGLSIGGGTQSFSRAKWKECRGLAWKHANNIQVEDVIRFGSISHLGSEPCSLRGISPEKHERHGICRRHTTASRTITSPLTSHVSERCIWSISSFRNKITWRYCVQRRPISYAVPPAVLRTH